MGVRLKKEILNFNGKYFKKNKGCLEIVYFIVKLQSS